MEVSLKRFQKCALAAQFRFTFNGTPRCVKKRKGKVEKGEEKERIGAKNSYRSCLVIS